MGGGLSSGSGGSAKVMGSDWDLLLQRFRNVSGWEVISMVPDSNPEERSRVNAMNSAWMSTDDIVGMAVDPVHCPQIVEDSEGTSVIDGGSGEIDKDAKRHPERTHMTDAMGYHVARAHPIVEDETWTEQL